MNIELLNKTSEQIRQCRKKYGSYSSRHEFYGILKEEFNELETEIFKKDVDFKRLEEEMVDCLTVLIKGYEDIISARNGR